MSSASVTLRLPPDALAPLTALAAEVGAEGLAAGARAALARGALAAAARVLDAPLPPPLPGPRAGVRVHVRLSPALAAALRCAAAAHGVTPAHLARVWVRLALEARGA